MGDSAALHQKVTDLSGCSGVTCFKHVRFLQVPLHSAVYQLVFHIHFFSKFNHVVCRCWRCILPVRSPMLLRHGLTEHSQMKHASLQESRPCFEAVQVVLYILSYAEDDTESLGGNGA